MAVRAVAWEASICRRRRTQDDVAGSVGWVDVADGGWLYQQKSCGSGARMSSLFDNVHKPRKDRETDSMDVNEVVAATWRMAVNEQQQPVAGPSAVRTNVCKAHPRKPNSCPLDTTSRSLWGIRKLGA
ncbi:hypothetical protein CC80DRAFT_556188 [Byssothecium circinans]|uniref:Uncharacterized protein n=1 Tax=Byssothecium circinans TaxID=147558 RepID=A0A6A5T7J5_9PLEO|nr:hypothetical protein CC80DRAFT_556284 [Byssothecium circinans]KAF1948623.1 hypothetical protein CC80DRAFT_556188 [Byssothecium circinans]